MMSQRDEEDGEKTVEVFMVTIGRQSKRKINGGGRSKKAMSS